MSGVMSGEVDAAEKARECWAWRRWEKVDESGCAGFCGWACQQGWRLEGNTNVPTLYGWDAQLILSLHRSCFDLTENGLRGTSAC